MHIPSSMMEGAICPVTAGVSIAAIGAAAYHAYKAEKKPSIQYFFSITTLVFVLQMLNYPVQNGTSGHVIGAVLAMALLGIPFGVLSVSLVVIVQAVFFADGGISVLGANILNMALVAAPIMWIARKFIKKESTAISKGVILGLTAWASVVIASLVLSAELALAGVTDFATVASAMVGVHALIGIGEGVITAGFVLAMLPEVSSTAFRKAVALPVMLAIFIGLILSPLASTYPDGLEWVAEQHNIATQ
ncbi:cobalamin biosynthesis protein CbiM [Candidatus Peregrinibacteria bacterium]|nr:cobalamin biosynthesis protein CbiM [Candidatus Peregrinibacteria bacterium]